LLSHIAENLHNPTKFYFLQIKNSGSSMPHRDKVVIQGIKEDGSKLRPSDWIERISSTLASFGQDQRLQYSNSVKPCMINGQKCLVVARGLEESHPDIYQYVMSFATSNNLKIQSDRRQGERALPCPVSTGE